MPFKRDLALQNTPLSKQPFKTQPRLENEEDIIWKSSIQSARRHKSQQA